MPRNFFNQDEDLAFVMDSYQSGMNSTFFNHQEYIARSAIMKKIARRRAPNTLPLLEQVEQIVSKVHNGQMKEKTGMQKLLEISESHGHQDLHNGILQKIGMLNGMNGNPATEFKPLAMFAQKQKKMEHPIGKFLRIEKAEEMTVKVKPVSIMGDFIALHGLMPAFELPINMRHKIPKNEIWIRRDVYNNPVRREQILGLHEQFEIDLMIGKHMPYWKAHKKAEKHEKMGWDPMTEDHPMAILMKQQKKEKPLMAGLFKQEKNEGWDPMKDEHPFAKMMKQQKKEKPTIPSGILRQSGSQKKQQKGWDPNSNQEHPLAAMFKKGRK
ncbi:MAG: hypothetical protein MUP17_04965 [candidate division Zixibacteria bacterium]|nr:hypothetical protein [candidate division Zixibacteria bacterium]